MAGKKVVGKTAHKKTTIGNLSEKEAALNAREKDVSEEEAALNARNKQAALTAREKQTALTARENLLNELSRDLSDREDAVAERERLVGERETALSASMQSGIVDADKREPEVTEHEHTFTKGLGPGMVELRICTFPGCGLTEKMLNGEWVSVAS